MQYSWRQEALLDNPCSMCDWRLREWIGEVELREKVEFPAFLGYVMTGREFICESVAEETTVAVLGMIG